MDEQLPNNNSATTTSAPLNVGNNITGILLQEKKIILDQYNLLKSDSLNKGEPIDKVLLDSKLVKEDDYYEARAKLIGIPFVSVATLPFSPEALSFVPKGVAEKYKVIPFSFDKERNILSLAMSDPLDLETVNFVKQKTNANIASFQGIPGEIKNAISRRRQSQK